MESYEKDLKFLRDKIAVSLSRLQMMEDAADVVVEQATDAGYRSGWYDGVMMAADHLRSKGFKSAAEFVESVAEMADLKD